MPERRPRRRADERRADVLVAARRLFSERGFHATSTRDLAKAADLNDALLYRYFTDKQAILEELVDMAVAAFTALPELDERARELPLGAVLHLVGLAFVDTARANVDLITILINEHKTLEDQRFVVFIDRAAQGLGGLIDARTGGTAGYLTARSYMGALMAFVLVQDVLGLGVVHPIDAAAYVEQLATQTARGASAP